MNHFFTKPGYCRFATLLRFLAYCCYSHVHQLWHRPPLVVTYRQRWAKTVRRPRVINRSNNTRTTTGNGSTFTLPAVEGDNLIAFYKDGYVFTEQTVSSSQYNVTLVLQKVIELNEVVIQKEKDKLFALGHLKDIDETAIYAGKKTEVVNIERLTANKGVNNARQIFAQVVGLTINENSDGGLQLNIGGRGLTLTARQTLTPAKTATT